MWRLAVLAVVAALMSPMVASGQDYTFGDWARDHGYSPGDVMPDEVSTACPYDGCSPAIDSLDGINEFDWTTSPTTELDLAYNQLSSIESGAFSGLTNLDTLYLHENDLSSIESGAFSGLTNLDTLYLHENDLSSIESGAFSGLTNLDTLYLGDNQLSSIESGAFSGLSNLRYLNLWNNQISNIEAGDFSGLTNLSVLFLQNNQISSIELGDFSGLTNLGLLYLRDNQISSIESGSFSGLTNLTRLHLNNNTALTELNLAEADFSSLGGGRDTDGFNVTDNVNITSVSLRNVVMNQDSLARLLDGGEGFFGPELDIIGIGELDGIVEMDLSGIDFANITDLEPLYVMDDLTDLWLVNTQNVDAVQLDVLLDNLETIESPDIEGVLYMTQANYDAFNTAGGGLLADWDAEPGHHVAFVIPEPSTLLLTLVALGVVSGWRKWAA